MAWTELTRRRHDRKSDKYASDMSDAEWALIAPLMPPPKTTGRPRTTCLREVFDAILYLVNTLSISCISFSVSAFSSRSCGCRGRSVGDSACRPDRYARVSTDDQNLDAQIDALTAAGAGKLFADKISGSKRERPELDKMLDQLRDGDVVTVTKYDRLARSLKDLLEIVEIIAERGAGFRSLAEDIDTTTPAGRLVFHVFASIAQFERERVSERTKEGLASARKRGRIGGRPPALTPAQKIEVQRMRDQEHRAVPEIARLPGQLSVQINTWHIAPQPRHPIPPAPLSPPWPHRLQLRSAQGRFSASRVPRLRPCRCGYRGCGP